MRSQIYFDHLYQFWTKTRRFHIWIWLAVHIAIAVTFLLLPSIRVNTELTAILPAGNIDQRVVEADRRMSAQANSGFYVLVGNPDFATARADALAFYDRIRHHGGLESATVAVDAQLLQAFQDYLFDNRYRLLPQETIERLQRGDTQSFAMDAIQAISSPLSVGALSHIEMDPWLLANHSLQSFLGSSLIGNMALGLKDGVLAARNNGVWYVLINGRTTQTGITAKSEDHIVPAMRKIAVAIQSQHPDTEFVWSGVAFHSYDSATNAQHEIELITSIAMAATIILLLLTFFSILPLISTLLTMGIGVAFGMAAAFITFGEVHIFTIVFGTSIIGISLDYSLYYFSERLSPLGINDGASIIRRSLPGITLALVTTLLSYIAFFILRFPLLQQMAVFSAMGLISTYLTVTLLYPRLPSPKRLRPSYALSFARGLLWAQERLREINRLVRWSALAVLVILTIAGLAQLKPNNDLRSLYKMSPSLAASEKKAASILQHGSSGQYFIIQGNSAEQVLQREEALTAQLDAGIVQKRLGSWIGSSLLLPSQARQKATYQLVGKTLMPELNEQMKLLDFDQAATLAVRENYRQQAGQYQDVAAYFKLPIASLTRTLWIGQLGNQWFAAVLVLKVKDTPWLRGLESSPGIHFMDKVADISGIFRDLSNSAFLILVVAYGLIFLGMVWLYGWRAAFRLFTVPLIASFATLGILGWLGIPLNLFVVMGLIMVPGIGSDYAIFFLESGKEKVVTMLAVFECMFGTCMSFGSLGFSALAGTFGLTVALGVGISFIIAPFTMPKQNLLPKRTLAAH